MKGLLSLKVSVLAAFVAALIVGVLTIGAAPQSGTHETAKLCTTEFTRVYAKPNDESQVFAAIGSGSPIWFSGVRSMNWLFVDFEFGSGWIASQDLTDCPPEQMSVPDAWQRKEG